MYVPCKPKRVCMYGTMGIIVDRQPSHRRAGGRTPELSKTAKKVTREEACAKPNGSQKKERLLRPATLVQYFRPHLRVGKEDIKKNSSQTRLTRLALEFGSRLDDLHLRLDTAVQCTHTRVGAVLILGDCNCCCAALLSAFVTTWTK